MIELMKRKNPYVLRYNFAGYHISGRPRDSTRFGSRGADVVYYWHRVRGVSISELALAKTVFVGKAGES